MLQTALPQIAQTIEASNALPGGVYHYVPDKPPQKAWGIISLTGWIPYDTPTTDEVTLDITVFGPLLKTITKDATTSFYTMVDSVANTIRPLPSITGVPAIRFSELRDVRLIQAGDDTRWAATFAISAIINVSTT